MDVSRDDSNASPCGGKLELLVSKLVRIHPCIMQSRVHRLHYISPRDLYLDLESHRGGRAYRRGVVILKNLALLWNLALMWGR